MTNHNTLSDSLVDLAARKKLPAHQYMDALTVEWIASHSDELPPAEAPSFRLPRVAVDVLGAAPVPVPWHAEVKVIESIHGTRHLMRTTAFAAMLAVMHRLNSPDTECLLAAAAVHDCRRVDDRSDPGHGERGADWLTENAAEVFGAFGLDHDREFVRRAAVAVRLHELAYDAFTERDTHDRASAELVTDLLKTADALDRYRLPKRKWWPDERHLRVVPPAWLHRFAFELVVDSERTCLRGAKSADAVFGALDEGGLV